MVLHLRWFCISNSPRTAVTYGVGNVRLSWSDVIRFIWSLYIWLLVANYLHVFFRIVYKDSAPERLGGPCFLWHVQENCLHANGTERMSADSIKFKTATRSEQLTL